LIVKVWLLIINRITDKIRESAFLKNSLAYSGTNVIEQLLMVLRSFAVRRILPPEIMGVWNFMTVVQNFLGTFDLGVISGATRELPIIGARNDSREKFRVYSTTLWFTIIQNSLISFFAGCYIYWSRYHYTNSEIIASVAGIIIFLISSLYTVYSTFFLTSQAFVRLSKISLACAFFDTAGFVLFSYLWGLFGLMGISVISTFLRSGVFIYFGHFVGIHARLQISLVALKRLLSFGFFLRVIDYPNALFNMATVLWVTKFMNLESLALFSMAQGFALQAASLNTRVGTVYTMRFLEQVGSGTPRDVIGRQLKQYLLFQLLVIMPFISWASFIAITFITNTIIPNYAGANKAFLILLISKFFYVLNSGLTNPWMAEKKLIQRGAANIFGLFVMLGAIAIQWFVLKNRSICDVASASVLGNYLYFVYMVIAVGKIYWSIPDCIKNILSVTAAAVWTFCVLYTGFLFMGDYAQGLLANIKIMIKVAFLTGIAILPVLACGSKISEVRGGWAK